MAPHEKSEISVGDREVPNPSDGSKTGTSRHHPSVEETTTEGPAALGHKREKGLLRKMDFIALPMLTCSWFIACLDRSNLGNARIMGMQEDLRLTDKQFFNCLSMFYISYVVFILPANLTMRIVGAPLQLGAGVIFFGVCSICLSAARSYSVVIGLRVLVGLGEAFVQSGSLYASIWWKRDELATRGAVYCVSATISGCFSGLIAYAVDKNLRGKQGLSSWRWLFIIEGVPAIIIGCVLIFFLPPFPELASKKHTWLFTRDEANVAVQRSIEANNEPNARIVPRQVWAALKDPKSYFTAIIYGSVGLGLASVSSFLPTFVRGFGFGRLETQLFSMIPYIIATFTLLFACLYSDRLNIKGPAVFLCLAISAAGYIVLMITTHKVALIVGVCFVTAGLYPVVILNGTWVLINHGGYTKRSAAWAMAQVTAQSCGIIGTQVYRHPPRFLEGHGVLLTFLVAAMFATVVNYWWMRKENRRKEKTTSEWRERGLENPDTERTIEELFDYHPKFKYIL